MADAGGPQALPPQGGQDNENNQNPPPNQNSQNPPSNKNPQNPPPPFNPFVPDIPKAPEMPCMPQLNWSHFKPEYSGKPDKDVEAHLLRTNDWMDTHEFLDQVKVQRFCLTLVGEARLWYESLRPINVNWAGLWYIFRQQYSKISNTREQLFHAWRSFHFDENLETIDAYINCIRQVATLLGYTSYKIILCCFSHNGLQASSRGGKENINKGEDRYTISRTDFLDSIYECKIWSQ